MRLRLFSALALCLVLSSPLFAQEYTELNIAWYNVENLFDTIDDPKFDDDEFLPTSEKQWTEKRYNKKLRHLARVIDSVAFDANWPDLLGVCEVENERVLTDLLRTAGADRKNLPILYDSEYYRGVDVALIYNREKFMPDTSIAHPIKTADKGRATRDILEVRGQLFNGDHLTVFVNHWPSRYGDSPLREATGDSLRQYVHAAVDAHPNTMVVLMGDFNDEPANPSIAQNLHAGEVHKETADDQLFCLFPTGSHGSTPMRGSHCYRGEWHQLDNIITWHFNTIDSMAVVETIGASRPAHLHHRSQLGRHLRPQLAPPGRRQQIRAIPRPHVCGQPLPRRRERPLPAAG